LGLAAISYDSPEILSSFSRQHEITFPLLSDAGSATIKRYGIVNTVADAVIGPNRDDPAVAADIKKYVSLVNPNAGMIGMAFPGTFIVDRDGRVKSRFFEAFYRERNTASSLMLTLGGRAGSVAGTQISTEHLEIKTYPTDAAVAFGNRFSVVVEITPRRGIHVYAPGAVGYRVIALTLAPQPFVRVLESQYPASQIYFFKPLNERVPVYEGPFTLRRELLLESSPEAQATLRGKDGLTLTGALNYQACDDRVCFNPASVPLSWTLTLQPLITERPK
jgi:peroxiredoxin